MRSRQQICLVNLDPEHDAPLGIKLQGTKSKKATGRILTADAMNAHNTFEAPDKVAPTDFAEASIRDGKLTLTPPSKSVVTLVLR